MAREMIHKNIVAFIAGVAITTGAIVAAGASDNIDVTIDNKPVQLVAADEGTTLMVDKSGGDLYSLSRDVPNDGNASGDSRMVFWIE